ncbi:hypothetical protein E1162_02305, partial [Rhodobacteraceae bacterium RKSG542]|uniref:hypothetical protein n=1 Tax=Pseudovibrio flavus TaxID=2529854 RepID=UPI00211CDC67
MTEPTKAPPSADQPKSDTVGADHNFLRVQQGFDVVNVAPQSDGEPGALNPLIRFDSDVVWDVENQRLDLPEGYAVAALHKQGNQMDVVLTDGTTVLLDRVEAEYPTIYIGQKPISEDALRLALNAQSISGDDASPEPSSSSSTGSGNGFEGPEIGLQPSFRISELLGTEQETPEENDTPPPRDERSSQFFSLVDPSPASDATDPEPEAPTTPPAPDVTVPDTTDNNDSDGSGDGGSGDGGDGDVGSGDVGSGDG